MSIIYTPIPCIGGWQFKAIGASLPSEDYTESQGIEGYDQKPYAELPGSGIIRVKDADTAILVLRMLNEGVIRGTWRRSNKDVRREEDAAQ